MSKNLKAVLFSIVLMAAVIGILMIDQYVNRVTMNPEGTIGNTAGNLNNGGMFCEYNGYVYYANVNDSSSLYRMKPDESENEKLLAVHPGNILAGGDYLYYFQYGTTGEMGLGSVRSGHNFHRADLDGKNITAMENEVVVTAQLVDNYLYLLLAGKEHPTLRKMKIDKSSEIDLAEYAINPACARDGIIYYNGTQTSHYLYTLNTANDRIAELWAGNIWYPAIDGDYIYYLDVENNYRLCRYVLSENIIQVVTQERVDCFNVGNGYIYYQVSSDTSPALKMMATDGSGALTLAEGNYTHINMTSQYVYFQKFGEDAVMYHSPIGSAVYSQM